VRSVADGFVVGGLATVVAVPLYALLRRRGEPTDRIAESEEREPAPVG